MIFIKALQYVRLYERTPEFQFNSQELDSVVTPIIGHSFIWMGYAFGKYFDDEYFIWDPLSKEQPPYYGDGIYHFLEDDVIKYQKNFEIEIKSFHKASKKIIQKK